MLTHTSICRVRHYECDGYGHVNNANYLRYAQETALSAWAARGFSLARLAAMGRGWQSQAIDIEYLRPLMYGESVEVRVTLVGFDGQAARLAAEFSLPIPTADVIARTTADVVFVDGASRQRRFLSQMEGSRFNLNHGPFPVLQTGPPYPAPGRSCPRHRRAGPGLFNANWNSNCR